MKALADHGELSEIMSADGGDCEAVLDQFAKAGIDVDALAARLQDEGAKSFVNSWNELMGVIASKSATLRRRVRCSVESERQMYLNTRRARIQRTISEPSCLATSYKKISTMNNGGFIMNVLVVDVGGTHVKILATGQNESRKFPSGPTLTPNRWSPESRSSPGTGSMTRYRSAIPGPVINNRPLAEPHNLGRGWMGFDFEAAFKRPVKVVNDAAMQAWGATRVARCCSWVWEPVSVPP